MGIQFTKLENANKVKKKKKNERKYLRRLVPNLSTEKFKSTFHSSEDTHNGGFKQNGSFKQNDSFGKENKEEEKSLKEGAIIINQNDIKSRETDQEADQTKALYLIDATKQYKKGRAIAQWPIHSSDQLFLPTYQTNTKEIDNYEMGEVIGKGAFSQVVKVKCKRTGEFYALKILEKSSIIKYQLCQQVQDEINIIKTLEHRFILKFISTWQSKGSLYQVFPLVGNGDLFTLWKRIKQFPLKCIAVTALEIAIALDFIHSKRIIYRDLKMENILINNKGHIVLSDFGLSIKLENHASKAYTICGTLKYIAPEVASGSGYSFQCDWWSFAVIIVTMATGKFPFSSMDNHTEMLEQIKKKLVFIPRLTSDDEIKEIAIKMLKYKPMDRLSSIDDLMKLKLFKNVSLKLCASKKNGPLYEYLK